MSKPILPADAGELVWRRSVEGRIKALERGRRTPGITSSGPDGIQIATLGVAVTPAAYGAYTATPNLVVGGTPITPISVTFRANVSGRALVLYGAQWNAGFNGTHGAIAFDLDGTAYAFGGPSGTYPRDAIIQGGSGAVVSAAPLFRGQYLTGLAEGTHTLRLLFYGNGGGGGSPISFIGGILIAIPL